MKAYIPEIRLKTYSRRNIHDRQPFCYGPFSSFSIHLTLHSSEIETTRVKKGGSLLPRENSEWKKQRHRYHPFQLYSPRAIILHFCRQLPNPLNYLVGQLKVQIFLCITPSSITTFVPVHLDAGVVILGP